MYHSIKGLIVGWKWKTPAGHEDQPTVEWWVEQIAAEILLQIGCRAYRRGDDQTLIRMRAALMAGATAEVKGARP